MIATSPSTPNCSVLPTPPILPGPVRSFDRYCRFAISAHEKSLLPTYTRRESFSISLQCLFRSRYMRLFWSLSWSVHRSVRPSTLLSDNTTIIDIIGCPKKCFFVPLKLFHKRASHFDTAQQHKKLFHGTDERFFFFGHPIHSHARDLWLCFHWGVYKIIIPRCNAVML